MTAAALIILGLSALCFAVRLVRGPTLADRVMGLDGIVIAGVGLIAVRAIATGDGSFLPVLVVVTLIGFVSTSASARFIENRRELFDEQVEQNQRAAPDGPDGQRGEEAT